jgi:hypothetical protein
MTLSTINIKTNPYNNIFIFCHVYTASIVTRMLIVIPVPLLAPLILIFLMIATNVFWFGT